MPPIVCARTKKRASLPRILPRRRKVSVMAGFMWAPERIPQGEYVNTIAVTPIAAPASALRTSGLVTSRWPKLSGAPSAVATSPAEIMNIPSAQPSMRYSGQWRRNASASVRLAPERVPPCYSLEGVLA